MAKKMLSKAGSVLLAVLIVIEILVITLIVFSKMSGNVPTLFGYQLYVIASPSMEPDIKVGDVIISKEYRGEGLEIGQVITYLGKDGDLSGKMITHEIVRFEGDNVITKGTANASEDPPISREDIRSVMKYKTVVISVIYRVTASTAGFICLVLLPLFAMIASEIVGLIVEIKKVGANENENSNE